MLLGAVHWGKAVLRGREGVKEASFQGCTQLPGKDEGSEITCLLRLFSSLVTFFLCPSSFLHSCHPQLYYTLYFSLFNPLSPFCSLFLCHFFPSYVALPTSPKEAGG